MELNFEQLHLFVEGMKSSREQNAEEPSSYEYGLNGRLYSENGKLSYSSIKGTVPIYNNPKIIKYLGFYAFPDELLLLVKYDENATANLTSEISTQIIANDISINLDFGTTQYVFSNELSIGAIENINQATVQSSPQPVEPLTENYNQSGEIKTIDFNEYYLLSGKTVPNYQICTLGNANTIPEYNKQYSDAFIVLKNDGYHAFKGRLAWKGNLNWDINRKITTVGIDEGIHYKRVYFTDNLNPLRVINLKDKNLFYRTSEEFNVLQDATLLQPKVRKITEGGSIKAMSVQYAYRLMTDNGQVTSFSPFSELIKIVKDEDGYDFAGGAIDSLTSKRVELDCPIISTLYSKVQCIAIEFKTDSTPTSFRNLGIQNVDSVVSFIHSGNESELEDILTIEEVIETKHIWTYCNDITIKNNKLIAAGLRNKPYSLQEKYVEDLFLFKGWDELGASHDNALINPTPTTYKYFDPTYTGDMIYVEKQLYTRFLFFGNVTLTLNNKLNPNIRESITFKSSADQYIDYTLDVGAWLKGLSAGKLELFPNLKIEQIDYSILFSPIDELIKTNMSNYYFTTSVTQVIIDFENQYSILDTAVNPSALVFGAQSIGFNQGTGIRVSFEQQEEAILNKSPELYDGGELLKLQTPSLKKTFVKDEIYRLGIQCYKSGSPLFTIVCGDIKTPAVGELDYKNQSDDGNQLFVHRLELKVEVRIPCEFKDYIDSYQIVYVERTENNRTILAQGLAGPLIRLATINHPSVNGTAYAPDVYDKWTLPFNGGPLYSVNGLLTYTMLGENWDDFEEWSDDWGDTSDIRQRVFTREIVNRRMFYFDSPDAIYSKISDRNFKNGKIEVLGRVNTDHTGHLIRSRFPGDEIHPAYVLDVGTGIGLTFVSVPPGFQESEIYKSLAYSKKIGYTNVSGTSSSKPYHVNVSVFSQFTLDKKTIEIDKTTDLLAKGEVLPSAILGTSFDISNMALTLFAQNAYNSSLFLSAVYHDRLQRILCGSHKSSNNSEGYPSIFIRAKEDVFTDDFIGAHRYNPIKSKPHTWEGVSKLVDINGDLTTEGVPSTDAHAIINIKMDNEGSIYGGRTKYAFSKNVFIPLSEVIPLKGATGDNQSQKFNVQGDFYVSLFLRTKNDYSNALPPEKHDMHQNNNYVDEHYFASIDDWNRGGAWAYAVVLETEIESRLADSYRFYRASGGVNFDLGINEFINSAYYKKNDLRKYIPVPFNFKDDPLMVSSISASKTKLTGDYVDAWTTFLLYEFYELEKSKGIITNITNWKDEIFAIQEYETNQINVDTTNFVTTNEGQSVAIQKGTGSTFTNHKKVSDFGTSIRRALAEGEFGFSFIDEKNKAFVKFGESLSLPLEIQLKLQELFQYNKIIDTEGYYDVKYKETNIRIRTESGLTYLLSYNELLQKFNGWLAYDNDIYITYDKRVFAPSCQIRTVVLELPEISSNLQVEMQVGKYSEYQITVAEEVSGKGTTPKPVSYTATNLPDGLNININTGLIYGVPTTVGTYNVPIVVTNSVGVSQVILIVIVNPATLVGETNGSSEVIGVLGYLETVNIEGISNGQADVYGKLKAKGLLEVTINGIATTNGTLIGRAYFDEDINGSSTVTGQIQAIGSLLGISNGVASVVGEITGKSFIYGISNNVATVVGVLLQPLEFTGYATTYDITNDCRILVTGTFSQYGTPHSKQTVNDIAIIDSCGNLDETFNANIGLGFNDFMYWGYGSAISHDGSIFVGGSFTTFNGVSTNRLVKLNPDGTRDWSFDIGTGFNKASAIPLINKDGSVFYFGRFDTYKGAWRGQIVKLTPNGTIDYSFSGYFTSNIPIQLMDVGYNQMIAHGYTVGYNGSYIPHIVRIDKTTGQRDWTFNVPVGPNIAGEGKVMFSFVDGEKIIMLSQFFTQWDNLPAGGIVRLNRNGSRDETFVTGTGFTGGVVYKGAVFEGKYIISGTFTAYNGTPCPRLVRLNQDGSLDNTFNWNNNYGDYGPYNMVVMGENIYVSEARGAGTAQYLLVVDRDGNAKRMKKNPNKCIPFSCGSRLKGVIYAKTYPYGILGVRPNDQIIGVSNGSAVVSADIIDMPNPNLMVGASNSSSTAELYVITFDTTWNVNLSGGQSSPSGTLYFPLNIEETYDFIIEWGDGTSDRLTNAGQADRHHTYVSTGTSIYNVKINGIIPFHFIFAAYGVTYTDAAKLISVDRFGPMKFSQFGRTFNGCMNLTTLADDPNFETFTSGELVFQDNEKLVSDITNWDTSRVTTMKGMFSYTSNFNQDITNWDTSNVTNMEDMFLSCYDFSINLFGLDVSKVTNTNHMFYKCFKFNGTVPAFGPLLQSAIRMFYDCTIFNQPLSHLDVSGLQNANSMFLACTTFNQDISGWRPQITNANSMFNYTPFFNSDLNDWDMSNCEEMTSMFSGSAFNKPLNLWNTSSLKLTRFMFDYNQVFNQDISSWDMRKVEDAEAMFQYANAFNQDLSGWQFENLKHAGFMAGNKGYTDEWNFSKLETVRRFFGDVYKGDLNKFDISNITDFTWIFGGSNINKDFSSWDVSHVTTINFFAGNNAAFNQPLNHWDVSNVTDMSQAFWNTPSFKQDISDWNISNVTNISTFFGGTTNYPTHLVDACIIKWSQLPSLKITSITFGIGKHSEASVAAKALLLSNGVNVTTGGLMAGKWCIGKSIKAKATTIGSLRQTVSMAATSNGLATIDNTMIRLGILSIQGISNGLSTSSLATNPFILEVTTTTQNQNVILPLAKTYNYATNTSLVVESNVDWGDGVEQYIESNTSLNKSHIYAEPGVYQVKLTGRIDALYPLSYGNTNSAFTDIIQWGTNEFKELTGAFKGYPNLKSTGVGPIFFSGEHLTGLFQDSTLITSVSENLFTKCPNLKSNAFKQTFKNCRLTTIHEDLFKSNTGVYNSAFYETFKDNKLISIPENLFRYNTEVHDYAFYGTFQNNEITTIPVDLFKYNTKALNYTFTHTFNGNSLLTVIPDNIFTNFKGTLAPFTSTFSNTGILSIPETLFAGLVDIKGGAFSSTFSGSQITSIPADLFKDNINVTSFAGTFAGTKITTIPADLFRYNTKVGVSAFSSCFNSCSELEIVPSDLFRYNTEASASAFIFTFAQTPKLKTIPADLFRYNTKVTTNAFQYLFYLSGITTLPADLFRYNVLASNYAFYLMCYGANELLTLPEGLFRYNVNANVGAFDYTFYDCNKLQLNRNIFYNDGEQATRFAGSTDITFSATFNKSEDLGLPGEAPDLWNCNLGTTPGAHSGTFGGLGNNSTSLSNYNLIPVDWK